MERAWRMCARPAPRETAKRITARVHSLAIVLEQLGGLAEVSQVATLATTCKAARAYPMLARQIQCASVRVPMVSVREHNFATSQELFGEHVPSTPVLREAICRTVHV